MRQGILGGDQLWLRLPHLEIAGLAGQVTLLRYFHGGLISFDRFYLAISDGLQFLARDQRVHQPASYHFPRQPRCQTTTRSRRCLANGSKSRSLCSRAYPLSIHRVAITVSMVLRTVTPSLRSARRFFAA